LTKYPIFPTHGFKVSRFYSVKTHCGLVELKVSWLCRDKCDMALHS